MPRTWPKREVPWRRLLSVGKSFLTTVPVPQCGTMLRALAGRWLKLARLHAPRTAWLTLGTSWLRFQVAAPNLCTERVWEIITAQDCIPHSSKAPFRWKDPMSKMSWDPFVCSLGFPVPRAGHLLLEGTRTRQMSGSPLHSQECAFGSLRMSPAGSRLRTQPGMTS